MDVFTNSMLKDWETCQNKYYYKYIKKIVIPQKDKNFELGKKVHAMISYYLNGFDVTFMRKSASSEVLEHYDSILKHPLLKQKCFLSEWGFTVNIANTKYLLTGRVDAVFFNPETNKYSIADWKTGMKIPSNPVLEMQSQIYLYAFYKARKDLKIDISPDDISFTFVQTPNLNETSLNFSHGLYEKFEKGFLNMISDINSYKYENIYEQKSACKYCEYKFLCQKNN